MSPTLPGGAVAVPLFYTQDPGLGGGGGWSFDPGGGGITGPDPGLGDPFLPNPTTPVGTPGTPTGPTLTVPPITIGGGGPIGAGGAGPGGAPTNPGQVSGTVGTSSTFGNVLGFFANPVRWVLLIIGLILIAGAVYLFKPTSEIVAAPARAARDALAVGAAS